MRCDFRTIILSLAALTSLCACKNDLPAPAASQSKIVLIGELVAGDSLQLRAGRSLPFRDSLTSAKPETEMQIRCYGGGAVQPLQPVPDGLIAALFTTKFGSAARVLPQTEYRVTAEAPGLTAVEALVQVPAAFSATMTGPGISIRNGDSVLQLRLSMSALPAASRYVLELHRQAVDILNSFWFGGYLYDYDESRALYDSLVRAGNTIPVLRDTSYIAPAGRQSFTADRSSAENSQPGSDRSYRWFFIRPESPALDFSIFIPIETGRQHYEYTLRLKSVAADYYNFLKEYEVGSTQSDNGGDKIVKPMNGKGNIAGGAGILGGVFLREFRTVH